MRVFRTSYRDRQGRAREASKWYVEFTDHVERVHRLPGFTDESQTRQLGYKLEKLAACRCNREGLDAALSRWLEATPQRIRDKLAEWDLIDGRTVAASKALADHLTDFQKQLEAKGATAKHVHMVHQRARDLLIGCGFKFWSDIQATRVETWLAELMATKRTAKAKKESDSPHKGRSIQSRNFYLQAAKQFCRWMVRNARASSNPLEHLGRSNVATDRRHDRRALSIDELRRLLDAATVAPERFGMSGAERALVYRLAVESGLRASELRSLSRGAFTFGRKMATVTVEAGSSKRRRRDELPLRSDTAELVRVHLSCKLPGAPVFNVPSSDDTANMLRADLEAARIAWLAQATTAEDRAERERSTFLAPVDENGHHADFHGLRHTFLTNLARSGVHPATAQRLARHSDVRLTLGRYTHVDLAEQGEALALLPDLSDDRQRMRATGTDSRDSMDSVSPDCLAEEHAFRSVPMRLHALDETRGTTTQKSEKPRAKAELSAIAEASSEVHPTGFEPVAFGSVAEPFSTAKRSHRVGKSKFTKFCDFCKKTRRRRNFARKSSIAPDSSVLLRNDFFRCVRYNTFGYFGSTCRHGPGGVHDSLNDRSPNAAVVGEDRKSDSRFTTSPRSSPASLSLDRRTNAAHCSFFAASSANSDVSATGVTVGIAVSRRANVARIASHRIGPSNSY